MACQELMFLATEHETTAAHQTKEWYNQLVTVMSIFSNDIVTDEFALFSCTYHSIRTLWV